MQLPNNPTWDDAMAFAQAEIASLRQKNDSLDLDPIATAALRGELKALKRLIDLPKDAALRAKLATQFLAGQET